MMILTKKKKQEQEKPRNEKLLSVITPIGMCFKHNKFYLGENLCRIYSVIKLPPEVPYGWLSRLTRIPGTIVSITDLPIDQGAFVQAMSKTVSDKRSFAETTKDQLRHTQALKSAADAERIMIDIEQKSEAVSGYGIQIMVLSRDKKELKENCTRVESAINALGCKVRIISFLQKEAYMQLSPTYTDQEIINNIIERPFLLSSFTGGYPFAKSEFCDKGGYYLGKSDSGGIVLFDLWKRTKTRTNSSISIIGDAGMGKSTAIKHIIMSEIARGTKIIIIDPEGEYKAMCCSEYACGKWIDVAGGRGGIINPLQIRPAPRDDDEEEKSNVGDLAIHLKTLQTFFSLYLPSLNDKHKAVLERVLIELYNSFNIDWNTDISKLKNTAYPTISDLHTLIKRKKQTEEEHTEIYSDLELFLSSAAEGADRGLWNGYTSIEADNKCICLDTKAVTSMGGGVLAAQYFNILSWCWQEMSKNKTERVMLIADECWMMIDPKCPQSLEFMRNAEKRSRKYEGSVVVATQQIVDFLDPQIKLYGQAVLDLPSIKLIFGMNGQGFKEVKNIFSLNNAQSRIIEAQQRGVALMCAGAEKFRIRFDLSPERLKMFGTGGGR